MRKLNWLGFAITISLVAWPLHAAPAGTADEEQQLLQVLQSASSLKEKDAACARLKWIGTLRSVPALAALLSDEQLSHSARYALESMHFEAANRALLGALDKTTGLTKVGIINSLAFRAEKPSAPALRRLLGDPDTMVSVAAARGLGQIGSAEAVKALQTRLPGSVGPLQDAVADGLLRCANRLLATGSRSKAEGIFERVYRAGLNPGLQLAAYQGMIRASGNQGITLVTRALLGSAGPSQDAALQMVRQVQGPDATAELARLLPEVQSPLQVALLEGLAQRGDVAAVSSIARLAGGAPPEVRLAVIQALDSLGDATVVPLLSEFAASGTSAEQMAARQALVDLHGGNVTDMLVSQMTSASPAVEAELARALGARGDKSAVPRLLDLAQQSQEPVRKSSARALGLLADEGQLPALVRLVVEAQDATARAEAAEAVYSAYQRLRAAHGGVDVEPLVKGLEVGSTDARVALLPSCSGLMAPQVRLALRAAVQDPEPAVREAGIRALCDTLDPDLLEDLDSLARTTREEKFRSLAIAAVVRLATQEDSVKISNGQRVTHLKAVLAAATRPEHVRMVLAGLGEVPNLDSLRVIGPVFANAAVQAEAARAAVKVALALPSSDGNDAMEILKMALAGGIDDATRRQLEGALKQLESNADYITGWQVAGPYREAGKDYSALFDLVLPPEKEDAPGVSWRPLPAGTDPARPWVMDLLNALGGQQCVAYARTWVHCDEDVKGLLELGSDDGIKVWVGDKVVYAANVARALKPGSDKVEIALHSGWNLLLLKVTQNNQGWAFCARLLKSDGSHLDGWRSEATPEGAGGGGGQAGTPPKTK